MSVTSSISERRRRRRRRRRRSGREIFSPAL